MESPILSIPAELLSRIFEACDDLPQVVALASACKHTQTSWLAHSPSIIWIGRMAQIRSFDDAFMAVGMYDVCCTLAKNQQRIEIPDTWYNKLFGDDHTAMKYSALKDLYAKPPKLTQGTTFFGQTDPRLFKDKKQLRKNATEGCAMLDNDTKVEKLNDIYVTLGGDSSNEIWQTASKQTAVNAIRPFLEKALMFILEKV